MDLNKDPGKLLVELAHRLSLVTSAEFKTPEQPRPPRARAIGEATSYQKALVTLREQLWDAHDKIHEEEDLAYGGHTGLPLCHELLHAAPDILSALLNANLANTFEELSGDVDYYIDPDWKVHVVRRRRYRKQPRARSQ